MSDIDEIVSRLDRRPDFRIVTYAEVGLPVFSVTPLITVREEASVGVLEEFVLKSLDAGVQSLNALTAFLGIPEEIIATQIGAMIYEQLVSEDADHAQYSLTSKGRTRLEELTTSRISKQEWRLYIDGLTRKVVPMEPVDLYSGRQLDVLGIPALTPSPRRPPKARDISLSQVNRLFGLYAKNDKPDHHAIKVNAFVKRSLVMFRRAIALAFKQDNGRVVAISFAIDGRLSEEHELAFANSGADRRSGLFKDLFDAGKRRSEIVAARRHIQEFAPKVLAKESPSPGSGRRSTLRLPLEKSTASDKSPESVRTLSSYEHPAVLQDALLSATRRLLIVSPWIRRQVVTDDFLGKLAACLGRGTAVTIAFGFGRVDRGERPEDGEAREALEKLSSTHKNLTLLRKSNIHAKVLLVDDRFFVTTSFNWLSFRGDPNQPLREEEGTYVAGKALVDEYFEKLIRRLTAS